MNTCTSKGTRNGKLKLKLVRPEKKIWVYDAQTCKNANPEPIFIKFSAKCGNKMPSATL